MLCSLQPQLPSRCIPASCCRLAAVRGFGEEPAHSQGVWAACSCTLEKSWLDHISVVCGAAAASPVPLVGPERPNLGSCMGWIAGVAAASPVPLVGPERPDSWGWAGFWCPHPYESTETPEQPGREGVTATPSCHTLHPHITPSVRVPAGQVPSPDLRGHSPLLPLPLMPPLLLPGGLSAAGPAVPHPPPGAPAGQRCSAARGSPEVTPR